MAFRMICPQTGHELKIIISWGEGWEHASASQFNGKSVPNWDDMCFVKKLCWPDEETAIQFHPRQSAYVNIHPGVLHLWRKAGINYELPPKELI